AEVPETVTRPGAPAGVGEDGTMPRLGVMLAPFRNTWMLPTEMPVPESEIKALIGTAVPGRMDPSAGEEITIAGGRESMKKTVCAGSAAPPARSVAWIRTAWGPSARGPRGVKLSVAAFGPFGVTTACTLKRIRSKVQNTWWTRNYTERT